MRRLALTAVLGLFGLLVPVPTAAAGAATLVRMPAHHRHVARATSYATNWSGYADYGATFSDVRASWVQPTVSCTSSGRQYASFWVGLDGYTSNSVEQIGTDSDCAGRNRPVYYPWYEMYPAASASLPSGDTVHASDSMTADVSVSGTTFTLTLKNNTRGWTFTTTSTSSTAVDNSAEWVAEAPSSCSIFSCSVLPLANFGTMSFTGASTTAGGQAGTISSHTNDNIVMVTNGGAVKAQPSALGSGGASFSDTWYHR